MFTCVIKSSGSLNDKNMEILKYTRLICAKLEVGYMCSI